LRAFLDDAEIVNWTGDFSRLGNDVKGKLRDSGHIGLRLDRDAVFHKITVREVSGVGKVDASVTATAAKPDDVPNITNWQDVTEKARERARGTSGLLVGNDGTISRTSAEATPILPLASQVPRDHAMRVRYTGEVQVATRRQGSDYLFALCQMKQTIFMRFRADAADSKSERIGATKTHPASFDPAHEHELLVTMQGSQLRVWMDGVFWGEGQDDSIKDGNAELMFGAQTVVKKVEIAELAAGAPPPPVAANWQDVTETVKEQAKAKPGFTIEGDLIAWTGDKGNPPRIDVTPAGHNDYAIRLKHIGAGQINVRVNEKGFVYVQAAPSGLRINRWMKGVVAPVTLFVAKDIPFSYAKGEPHDLTVTVQGSTIRAWLDGQLMGTVEDTMFAEGTGAVALVSYGKVQKVETAALPTAASAAAWTDWLGPKLAAGDFAANGWVRSSNGVTTEREISGLRLLPPGTKNAAVRVTYVLQDSQGLMLNARERMDGKVRLGYCAIDKVTQLHLNRLKPDGRSAALQHVMLPAEPDRMAERTLELRMIGNQITATLNGTFAGTATDDTLSEGEWTIVFLKGVLVNKVEVQPLDAAP
jgi:hypothetical protein